MEIYILSNNIAKSDNFMPENGISLYVKTKNHNMLLDFGMDRAIVENAKALNLDLSQVDVCFLSHGHYDHGNGMLAFFEINTKAKVYASLDVFKEYYKNNKYIGLDPKLSKYMDRFIFFEDEYFVDDSIHIFTANDRQYVSSVPYEGYTVNINGGQMQDEFNHEAYIILSDNKKRILYTACNHKGLSNILHWSKYDHIDGLIGSFKPHLRSDNPEYIEKSIENAANELLSYNINYYFCHCTQKNIFEYLKPHMGDKAQLLQAGDHIKI